MAVTSFFQVIDSLEVVWVGKPDLRLAMAPDGEHGKCDGDQHHGVEGIGQECDLD